MLFRRIFHPDKSSRTAPIGRQKGEGERLNSLPADLVHQLDRLRIRGSRELRGDRMGMRSSHRRKPSTEFREYRVYVPGDDIRYVDWRASARQENIFVKQGELPKDTIIYLLLDCSASMRWGAVPKSVMQLKLAAVFGYLTLSQGDQLFVLPYGGTGNHLYGPVSGKGQFGDFNRYLNQLSYSGESSLSTAISSLKKRITRGGILFVISDLLERGNLDAVLGSVPAPLWWVNVVHLLHPEELEPSLRGAFELVDQETGASANYDLDSEALRKYAERIDQWQKGLELACVNNHALYSLINSNDSLEKEVIPSLRSQKVLVTK